MCLLNKDGSVQKIAMTKTTLAQNIKFLLKENGLSEQDIQQQTGVKQTTIYQLVNGDVTSTKKSTVSILSDFFGVEVWELTEVNLSQKKHHSNEIEYIEGKALYAVPVLEWQDITHFKRFPIGYWYQHRPTTCASRKVGQGFALTVDSKDYLPYFNPGVTLIFSGNRAPEQDNIVLAMTDKPQPTLVKCKNFSDGLIYLQSLSDANNTMLYSKTYSIQGVLIEERYS
ncbi:helix-turn-helix transcriptional regulator [Endozoicomonas sp. SM1973]|uniref:Helix-turn-helix transcriptional regulator n=1 Tax=Spartinivicinus marinus TaxID=2994442 RepID=A0A853I4Q8_9GAMM|nr:helix-turn-helix domain-containing protein [Spartinivicinus marinus]MCX4029366.1 helix-turn-helix domain-containing protein [Spartinivicinus marinus]NYZ64941.1 helix-turn-helix transcriptional regulator [Spartinivicinus marinus]